MGRWATCGGGGWRYLPAVATHLLNSLQLIATHLRNSLQLIATHLRNSQPHRPRRAGKTTLIHVLTGVVFPTSGDATICGLSVRTDMHRIRQSLGACRHSAQCGCDLHCPVVTFFSFVSVPRPQGVCAQYTHGTSCVINTALYSMFIHKTNPPGGAPSGPPRALLRGAPPANPTAKSKSLKTPVHTGSCICIYAQLTQPYAACLSCCSSPTSPHTISNTVIRISLQVCAPSSTSCGLT